MIGGARFRLDTDIARQAALSARIARGQSDVATGKRLQVASDDPAASSRIGQITTAQTDASAWQAVIAHGAALAARADAALGAAQTNVDRARELMLTGISATTSPADRLVIADALRGLADDLDGLGGQLDASGQRVFPDTALELRVGSRERVTPTLSHATAFTLAGTSFADSLRAAATTLTAGTAAQQSAALTQVTMISDALAANRALVGGRAARLDAIAERLTDTGASLSEELSTLADTDVAATIARIQADTLALDASRSLFARVNRQTLFDLLG